MPSYSGVWTLPAQYQAQGLGNWPSPPALALFGGGFNGANLSVIDSVLITSSGNATTFGNLTNTQQAPASVSSATRALWAGGANAISDIGYVTMASIGNATSFGVLTAGRARLAGASNNTRGLFMGGQNLVTGEATNTVDYVTIATTGNATDFGDMAGANRFEYPGGLASPTRALVAGGRNSNTGAITSTISYFTIATTGNFTSFGLLTSLGYAVSGCSSSTRGIYMGGSTTNSAAQATNVIQYVTIATEGNATDFGDLTAVSTTNASTSNSIIGLCAIGQTTSGYVNTISQITIATTGNATAFGQLSVTRGSLAACSNAHGGL